MSNRSPSSARLFAAAGGFFLIGIALYLRSELTHPPAKGDVAKFTDTEIVAHPDIPLDPNKNVIWCGTMGLAWNEAIALLHGPLLLAPPVQIADLLNRQEFLKSDLDEESYVAMAGFASDSIGAKFNAELRRKFGDAANLPQLDSSDSPGTDLDFTIYAFLMKNLKFANPFNNNEPLTFGWTKVSNFGFGYEKYPSREAPSKLMNEVRLLNYVSDDNFVIQLNTTSPSDQLILAKISPGKTLTETVQTVVQSIKGGENSPLYDQDTLAIPKVDFDLTKHFKELENHDFAGGRLHTAAENVVFRLNEKGVELTAFSTIDGTLGVAAGPPAQPRHLVFNKPFLILLKRESSPRPYFAMWVGNPTLLVSP